MLKRWKALADRFEKLSLRERSLVAIASVALVYLVIDTLFVSPLALRHRSVLQDIAQKQQQAESMGAQLRVLRAGRGEDPDVVNRRRLQEMHAQLARLQTDIADLSALLVPADRMPLVLERLLANHPRLELVDMRLLPRGTIDAGQDAKSNAPASAASRSGAATASEQGAGEAQAKQAIYRYGMELSIRGSYLDLLGYLKDIERSPHRIYWQRMDLSVTGYPVSTLKLTLYTVSLDNAWMKV